MPFKALWRPVLALEAWVGHVDTRMADMSRAGYDDHRLVYDMLLQQAALQGKLQETRDRVFGAGKGPLLNQYLWEKISSLTAPDLAPNSVKYPSTSAVAGEATGDGTVSDIMGDEIGEETIEGAGETGSEPDDHLGDGGV
nr:hypothetical protein [Tanacetum cinerariifolium]